MISDQGKSGHMWGKILRVSIASFAFSLLCISLVLAQERTVRGTVTDGTTGEPLPGVNITVQDTQIGTTTDVEGTYEIEVPGPEAVLAFSFVGYQTEEVEVGDQEVIDVALQEDVGRLEEIVVTGYGTQRRQEITGAISSVDVAEANVGQISSPQDLLQGRVAGVSITSNSGEPGADQRVYIRGRKSLSANAQPLYVIDGTPVSNTNITPSGAEGASNSANPLSLLDPQDIESIQVLKDAAATSIYGSQGSNGVILIETKEGVSGALQVDYRGQVSLGEPARELDVLDADQFRSARREFFDAEISPEEEATNTDWQDEVMRSTVSQQHNISFSGSTEQTSYRASFSYVEQEGLLLNSGFDRVSGRINVRHSTLDDRLRLDGRLFRSQLTRDHIFRFEQVGASGSVIKDMLVWAPTNPVRDEDGDYFEFLEQNPNPVGLLEQITDVSDQNRSIGHFSAEFDILENLTVRGALNADISSGVRRSAIPRASIVGESEGGIGSQGERNFTDVVAQSTARYNYDRFLGGTLRMIGGFEFERETFQTLGVETRNFITDAFKGFNNLGGGTNIETPSSGKEQVNQLGFFGQANYNFENKYLLTASFRRDGSSVFGSENKWAGFPSASVGWDIAQEPFMNVQGLSQLKLRVSGGVSGNQAVPPLRSLALLESSRANSGVFGAGNEIIGTTQTEVARPNLKWEVTTEFNAGVDLTYGPLNGSVEYYRSNTEDLLLNVRVLQPAPSSFVLDNVGEVSNEGIEVSIEALALDREEMRLTVSANASSNRNEIEDLGGRGTIDHGPVSGRGLTGITTQRLEAGHPIGSFYGPVFVGIEDGQEVYDDGEGGTTTDAGEAPNRHLGNPIPDVSYSFNADFQYRSFDFGVFFRGEQGRELYNNTALLLATKSRLAQGLNMLESALDDGTGISHNPEHSSRWVQDASFLRLEKLTLGYDFSDVLGQSDVGDQVRSARVFISGDNLFIITPYDGYDPEMNANPSGEGLGFRNLSTPSRGLDFASFPRSRTVTMGIQLGF